MQKFTEQNIFHSAFVTAGKPPLISYLIFPDMPTRIQTIHTDTSLPPKSVMLVK